MLLISHFKVVRFLRTSYNLAASSEFLPPSSSVETDFPQFILPLNSPRVPEISLGIYLRRSHFPLFKIQGSSQPVVNKFTIINTGDECFPLCRGVFSDV